MYIQEQINTFLQDQDNILTLIVLLSAVALALLIPTNGKAQSKVTMKGNNIEYTTQVDINKRGFTASILLAENAVEFRSGFVYYLHVKTTDGEIIVVPIRVKGDAVLFVRPNKVSNTILKALRKGRVEDMRISSRQTETPTDS